MPKAKDQSNGWTRRFKGCIHQLKNTYTNDREALESAKRTGDKTVKEADPNLEYELTDSRLLNGALLLALQGYEQIIKNGYHFSQIDIDRKAELEFSSASNHLIDFFDSVSHDVDLENGVKGGWYINEEYNKQPLMMLTAKGFWDMYLDWIEETQATKFKYTQGYFYKNYENALKKVCEVIKSKPRNKSTFEFVKRKIERSED